MEGSASGWATVAGEDVSPSGSSTGRRRVSSAWNEGLGGQEGGDEAASTVELARADEIEVSPGDSEMGGKGLVGDSAVSRGEKGGKGDDDDDHGDDGGGGGIGDNIVGYELGSEEAKEVEAEMEKWKRDRLWRSELSPNDGLEFEDDSDGLGRGGMGASSPGGAQNRGGASHQGAEQKVEVVHRLDRVSHISGELRQLLDMVRFLDFAHLPLE